MIINSINTDPKAWSLGQPIPKNDLVENIQEKNEVGSEKIEINKNEQLEKNKKSELRFPEKPMVTLEERLKQVISPEEIKSLLSMMIRTPWIKPVEKPTHIIDIKR